MDAKAEGSEVVVGGWSLVYVDGRPCSKSSRWFAVNLDEKSAPWAFHRGELFKAISAFEVYASLVAVIVLGPDRQDSVEQSGTVQVSGFTDSQVATSVINKASSSKFPLCVMGMELAAQLEARGVQLTSEWAPREQNKEADALTNHIYDDFNLNLRIHVEVAKLPFLLLPQYMDIVTDLTCIGRSSRVF